MMPERYDLWKLESPPEKPELPPCQCCDLGYDEAPCTCWLLEPPERDPDEARQQRLEEQW